MAEKTSGVEASLAGQRPAQILIVDDSESNVIILERFLQKLGYQPQTADNGKLAFSIVTNSKIDLILMDIMMPGIDGLELTRAIRNSGSASHPIIVAVTADGSEKNRDACFLAGVDDFLPKPVDLPSITNLIETWIPLAESR